MNRIQQSALGGTFALRAPKVFQFGFKRRPISAVFGLLGTYFGVERFAQRLALSGNREAQQRAPVRLSASFIRETPCQTDETLWCSGFSQPKRHSLRRGLSAQSSIVAF